MMLMRKSVAAAAMAGSLLVGGATGAILFGPSLAGAQTSTTTPGTQNGAQNGSTFKSNEDPAHEAKESPEQEAAEDSGQFRGGHGMHGSNEDPAHEATETPEREAAEDARAAAGGGASGTAPSTAPSSGTATNTGAGLYRHSSTLR
jgi:hypothetical protein